jgi:hypothetical protein
MLTPCLRRSRSSYAAARDVALHPGLRRPRPITARHIVELSKCYGDSGALHRAKGASFTAPKGVNVPGCVVGQKGVQSCGRVFNDVDRRFRRDGPRPAAPGNAERRLDCPGVFARGPGQCGAIPREYYSRGYRVESGGGRGGCAARRRRSWPRRARAWCVRRQSGQPNRKRRSVAWRPGHPTSSQRRTSGSVSGSSGAGSGSSAPPFGRRRTRDRQQRVRQERQRHMPAPAVPAPHLVVGQPRLPPGFLEAAFKVCLAFWPCRALSALAGWAGRRRRLQVRSLRRLRPSEEGLALALARRRVCQVRHGSEMASMMCAGSGAPLTSAPGAV